MNENDQMEIQLTGETINTFLEDMEARNCKPGSVSSYRQTLNSLASYLPSGQGVNKDTAAEWKIWLEEQGFSRRTVNARISVLNSFLKYAGKREWQETDFYVRPEKVLPELTRAEYIRLLRAAKRLGKEREYLLIKVMGSMGVRIHELDNVTIDAVKNGMLQTTYNNRKQYRKIPGSLQKELLAYAKRENIVNGQIFLGRNGGPMVRSTAWYYVSSLSQEAQVDVEKVNPRSLYRMYCSTWEGLEISVRALMDQMYEKILDEEQLVAGWED